MSYLNGNSTSQMKRLLLIVGILLLFAVEIFRVYFIMPFPGSQRHNSISLAYFIDRNRLWLRIAGWVLVGYALLIHPAERRNLYDTPRRKSNWPAVGLSLVAVLYAVVFYLFNYRFEADKMFEQPRVLAFTDSSNHALNEDRLVIGVVINNQAKAYPIQLIGYHHQVRDTLGGTPIMVTYCTVCRTGRVYSPLVHGRPEEFRLVGMDHFNAMFEDESTKSWWQQATGVAVAGPLTGARLPELPSGQYSLGAWLKLHPGSKVMQPDPADTAHYAKLADYDKGTIDDGLERRDSGSWRPKSWVVGVVVGGHARAYDWNWVTAHPVTEDTIGSRPVAIYYENNNFRVVERTADGQVQPLQSYQEFWHSWSHFHPGTTRYRPGPGDGGRP